jgi:hypothetical protein
MSREAGSHRSGRVWTCRLSLSKTSRFAIALIVGLRSQPVLEDVWLNRNRMLAF